MPAAADSPSHCVDLLRWLNGFPAILIGTLPDVGSRVTHTFWVRCGFLENQQHPCRIGQPVPCSVKDTKSRGNGLTIQTQFYTQPESPHNCKCHEFKWKCKLNSPAFPRFQLPTHTGSAYDFQPAGSIPYSLTRRLMSQHGGQDYLPARGRFSEGVVGGMGRWVFRVRARTNHDRVHAGWRVTVRQHLSSEKRGSSAFRGWQATPTGRSKRRI